MTPVSHEVFGILAVLALLALFSVLGACIRVSARPYPAPPLDETTETFDASLLPISDSEVARRLRRVMDENAAVRQLRDDVDAWGA